MKIEEIIVVEGKDDTNRIKQAVEADTIETNGSAINEETLQLIAHAQATRGVIIFTDPDYPGGKIRETIVQRIPGVKQAFLRKADAQSPKGGSLGIEHASPEIIREALRNVYTQRQTETSDIDRKFLDEWHLVGHADSARYRELLGDALGIGHTNGKQLLKRLRMFQLGKEDVNAAMMAILQELEEKDSLTALRQEEENR
ncbi:ribonuclease M5 [Trichococcus ilyis]|jgi:ribonuclease M5|uniref:Ribonuclease M5 n=1 Tax=Trichococcus ilyis TaxID=640938 RepID=A0A143Z550_9LACT|nr:ribonuclease M5 [Trichococcus ilyis]CZR03652.1 ribonuclease m5 [Trichococcus ilyis]SEJ42420.1 ribonuclease M5 [Trichococcus ilyis]